MGNAPSNEQTAKDIGQIAEGVKNLTELAVENSEELKLSLEEYRKAKKEMHKRILNYGLLLDEQQKKEDPRVLVTPLTIAHARLMMTAAIVAVEYSEKTYNRLFERQSAFENDLETWLTELAKMQVDYPAAYTQHQMMLRQKVEAYSLN
jgi:hypothetical protein